MFYGKTHYKWQFSIAMLNYQRVTKSYLSTAPILFPAIPAIPAIPIPIQEAQNLHPLNVSAGNAQHWSHLLPSQAGVDHEDGHREDVEERPHGIFEDLELQGLKEK